MDTFTQERARVLIVDDQKNWREALCDMLDPAYEIETAAKYNEAEQRLRERAFHVVVADQRLVDQDATNIQGILLLDAIKALKDGTKTIIVTGYPTIAAAKEALRGRDAFDYLLKYPEEGGPFKIREYRERVAEGIAQARAERHKAITLDFSVSSLVRGLTYERIAEVLLPDSSDWQDATGRVRKVLNRLLLPLQPFAQHTGRVWLWESRRLAEILCWSRGQSKAVLCRVGLGLAQMASPPIPAREGWRFAEAQTFASEPLTGNTLTIEGVGFEAFAELIKEE